MVNELRPYRVRKAKMSFLAVAQGCFPLSPVAAKASGRRNADTRTWLNLEVLNNTSLKHLRQDVRIDLLNEAGQPVHRYILHRCWVSEFQALPDLDAGANAHAIEHIKIENEGWEHDLSLPEPPEK